METLVRFRYVVYAGIVFIIGAMIVFVAKTCYMNINLAKRFHNKKEESEEFEKIYKTLPNEALNHLKRIQTTALINKVIIIITVMLAAIIITIFLTKYINAEELTVQIIIFLILWAILIATRLKTKKSYVMEYKKQIIEKVIKPINKNLTYLPEQVFGQSDAKGNLDIADYKEAKFDYAPVTFYSYDDFIEGDLANGGHIKMANLKTGGEVNSPDGIKEDVLFEGIFAVAELDKKIEKPIKILRNSYMIKETVEMDSREFEKYFDVITEDRILATRVLTHDLMETLSSFSSKIRYDVIIKENKVYMRFNTGPMFEPKLQREKYDKELIYAYYCILKSILEISEEISKAIQILEV